jgi:hypothetical protein
MPRALISSDYSPLIETPDPQGNLRRDVHRRFLLPYAIRAVSSPRLAHTFVLFP